ncbi:DHA2 family efflux MFS transporter permease subunit [Oxalobacteraceae bacterium CAVE-383]|nr:DHA2 family efflux MFS transporter permease subunit [Oxalobacteraceae bacterium CAVE-383]
MNGRTDNETKNGAGQAPDASINDWIAVAAGALGALMATLDISITNTALPQIQGEIGATGTEGTWISTGYLVSEVVMIPLAAWLTRVFGLRNFLLSNAALFIIFSMICGLADNLPQMIIGRVGQGFTGGALIPTAQTIIATRLPRHQMPVGMAAFGSIILLGPMLGPVIGGWLAENISWAWCFFLNLPVCAALMGLLLMGLEKERVRWPLFLNADWLGIAGLALGLSCLTIVLEEGQRERWFESTYISVLSVLTATGFVLLAVAQWRNPDPVIKLRLLLNKNYASVIFIVVVVGASLYSVLYLLPQFLSNIAGYNAEQSGFVMLLSGLPAFLMMPFLPRLLQRFSVRSLVMLGLVCFAASCMLNIEITAQSTGPDFTWSQILRGFGLVFCMMPLNQASMAAVPSEESGDAAGLYNMARNIGGSIGLALLGTFIDRRSNMHTSILREAITANSLATQERIAGGAANLFQRHGDMAYAQLQSAGQLALQTVRQGFVITYGEAFYTLGVVMLCCIPLTFFLKKPKPGAGMMAH